MSEDRQQYGAVYVSGRITGDRRWFRHRFAKAEALLREQGFVRVANPAALTDTVGYETYADALKFDISIILQCSHIYMLTGWRESPGAVAEWVAARACGLTVLYEDPTDAATDWRVEVSA